MNQNHVAQVQPLADRSKRTLRQRLHIQRYPVWSAKWVALLTLLVVALSAALVYGLGKRSLFVETELTLGVIATGLFLFLTTGLYRGVRMRREQLDGSSWSVNTNMADLAGLDWPSPDLDLDPEGIVGAIVAVVLAVVVFIVLVVVAWVLLSFVWGLTLVLAMALFWLFNRALRQVFSHSRQCSGNLPASLGYAALYTTLYTGWLFALVWAIHHLLGVRES